MEIVVGNSFLDKYFDPETMSIHLKENRPILKKIGRPGDRYPHKEDNITTKDHMHMMIEQIFKEVEARNDGFLEIDRTLSKVIQLGPYRIVIVYPPLSNGLEMTIVKPTKKLNMDDYNLPQNVLDLFKNVSKGILISGSPGSGKTTFAQALVDLYHKDNHIIKTIESPRDLMVSEDVVQYSFTYGGHDEVRDILLLSRPDYTVYDEIRNKPDFELYKDLRLTGIGLIGVIHATRPVDSIQRFLGSIEMGIIPQVIDTVIFINKGAIEEILQLSLVVKVPAGMQSEDLARPVIVIKSFFTQSAKYEIYTFGEQIVVVPLDEIIDNKGKKNQVNKIAEGAIKEHLKKMIECEFIAKVKGSNDLDLYIGERYKAGIIGKGGANIEKLEKKLGIRIHLKDINDLPVADIHIKTNGGKSNGQMDIQFPSDFELKQVCLSSGEDLFFLDVSSDKKVIIKDKSIIKSLEKKGFLIIDTGNI